MDTNFVASIFDFNSYRSKDRYNIQGKSGIAA
jgi:hypothetical protein